MSNPSKADLLSSISRDIVKSVAAAPAEAAVYPLNGTVKAYRGWYHVAATGKSRWCPRQSRHGGPRPDGAHVGADLWSGAATKIVAVRSGSMEYNPRPDPDGWGNHIYLYFKEGGKTYIAVYAHLDAKSAFTGVRAVTAGQEIGTPGCSGNAGVNGTCPRNFKCSGKIAIADHLHFEVMDAKTTVRSDPVAFFGFTVQYANDDTCAECGSADQLR